MSKAKERALEFVPVGQIENHPIYTRKEVRKFVEKTYEQAEKDTIERASEWFRTHWREYIMGPDADGCVGFGHWENDFKKAMEEE